MTEFDRTLDWLYALEAAKGMDFKLERVALALQRFGDPHRSFPSFHIAGTNGKGSVAAMLHAVLMATGYRAGLFTSPHLVRLTERIRVGQDEISRDEVVSLTAEIQRSATSCGIELTFFEFMTVMAFVHFARQAVEVGVVEVGLGGRLDATNVVDPAVSVITTIGLDHTHWLGDSLAEVAAEKGGIIKTGRPLVVGKVADEVAAVLEALAAARGAPVIRAGTDYRISGRERLDFSGVGWDLSQLTLKLDGAYQRENTGTALASLAAVRGRIPVTEDAVRAGLASVRWPGRFDVVATAPLTILDGAHNCDAMTALVQDLPAWIDGRRLHVLFAVMRDKDWRPMVHGLGPICHSAVVTEVLPQRAQACAPVAEVFRRYCPTVSEPNPERAWADVQQRSGGDDAILIAGSLFLVGAVSGYRAAHVRGARSVEPGGLLYP